MECQYYKTNKDPDPDSFYSQEYLLKGNHIDFINDLIRIENVLLDTGIILIFIHSNQQRINSYNSSSPNYFAIILNEMRTINEFKEFSWDIVNNLELKLKVRINKSIEKINNHEKKTKFKVENPFHKSESHNINFNNNSGEEKIEQFLFRKEVKKKESSIKPKSTKDVRKGLIQNNPNDASNVPIQRQMKPAKTIKVGNENDILEALKKIAEGLNKETNNKNLNNNESQTNIEGKNDFILKESNTASNRNFSTATRKAKNNLKDKYNMSNNLGINIYNELNQKKDYYKKLYYNAESINYSQYLKQLGKEKTERETFCEGFFLASFPQKKGEVIENSQTFPSPCGHDECSTFPAMKPEIIMRYPLVDTKNLELNNLAATICFPTGIKVCYSEEPPKNMIDDFLTSITNQKGERYYMMTYHFYQKINNNKEYTQSYEMHPLKHHLMTFGESYIALGDKGITNKIQKKVEKNLELCQKMGFRDYVYVPFCLCIISKYPYAYEMTKCLQSIFNIMSEEKIISCSKNNFKINDLIMHLINSVPIPLEKNTRVKFFVPFFEKGISLKCPKLDEINIVNINYMQLIELFSIDNVIIILRLLLFEKKILFIDSNYTRLSEVTDAFISLLYPFKWVHTYIPIMSDQMIKYLETFLPFLNGIHSSLLPLVTQLFNEGEIEDSEDVILIYIKEGKIDLSSSLKKKKKKLSKYLQKNIPDLPSNLEKNLKSKLTEIKYSFHNKAKENLRRESIVIRPVDPSQYDIRIRIAFIEMFVDMFIDYPKYMSFLDNDVVFNKNSFLNSVDNNYKKFFEEFLETQLFQQFTQIIFTDECNYFNDIISIKNNEKSDFSGITIDVKSQKIYTIPPNYLGTNEKDNKEIKNFICQNYPSNLDSNFLSKNKFKDSNQIILPQYRIIPKVIEILDKDYINDKCLIYLLPIQKSNKTSELRNSRIKIYETIKNKNVNKNEIAGIKKNIATANFTDQLSQKEQDEIKEIIRDYLRKIFQSEKIDYDDPKIKTEILNILKKQFAREFFVSLLSSNLKNIVSLQLNSFKFLGFLIYNVLVEFLQVADSYKLLEEVYLLIKSTLYFGYEHKKKTQTLFQYLKSKIKDYPKINQINFWNIWYDDELNKKKDKEELTKQSIILDLCDKMLELQISKMTIVNILDNLRIKSFSEFAEINSQTQELYVKKIKEAKYQTKSIF